MTNSPGSRTARQCPDAQPGCALPGAMPRISNAAARHARERERSNAAPARHLRLRLRGTTPHGTDSTQHRRNERAAVGGGADDAL